MTADDADDGTADPSRQRTRAVFDRIGDHFSQTRARPWPAVEDYLESAPKGTVGLDVGCGNGRHTEPLTARVDRAIGLDASLTLLRAALDRAAADGWRAAFVQGDAGRLPIRSSTIDLGLYIATLHHLPDRATRVASLDELARVLAPGGEALVSVWSTAHDTFDANAEDSSGFDTTVDWTLPDGETVPRFYHIYAPAEFEADLERSTLRVRKTFLERGNAYARVGVEEKRP